MNRLSPLPYLLFGLLLLTACGGRDSQKEPSASARKFDVSFDSANRTLFFTGRASTAGQFDSTIPFSLWFSLAADPLSAENEAARFLLDNHGPHITQRATYRPIEDGTAQIDLLNGRLTLRGRSKRNGQEFEGNWYFDGLPGGGFWIAPEGVISP